MNPLNEGVPFVLNVLPNLVLQQEVVPVLDAEVFADVPLDVLQHVVSEGHRVLVVDFLVVKQAFHKGLLRVLQQGYFVLHEVDEYFVQNEPNSSASDTDPVVAVMLHVNNFGVEELLYGFKRTFEVFVFFVSN